MIQKNILWWQWPYSSQKSILLFFNYRNIKNWIASETLRVSKWQYFTWVTSVRYRPLAYIVYSKSLTLRKHYRVSHKGHAFDQQYNKSILFNFQNFFTFRDEDCWNSLKTERDFGFWFLKFEIKRSSFGKPTKFQTNRKKIPEILHFHLIHCPVGLRLWRHMYVKIRLKTYKMATCLLLKFLNLGWDISRTIWRVVVSDG